MNITKEYKSLIASKSERLVRKISDKAHLVEMNGHYYVKNVEEGKLHYRGIDSEYDDIETLLTVKRGE